LASVFAPLIQLFVVLVIVEWFLKRLGINLRSSETWKGLEWNTQTIVAVVVIGAFAVAVYLTGEPAQEAVEKLPGFPERLIDRHEDAALLATILTGTIGALALAALVFYRRRPLPRSLTAVALVCALGTAVTMAYTANLGGQIRHAEIRGGAASPVGKVPAVGEDVSDEH